MRYSFVTLVQGIGSLVQGQKKHTFFSRSNEAFLTPRILQQYSTGFKVEFSKTSTNVNWLAASKDLLVLFVREAIVRNKVGK